MAGSSRTLPVSVPTPARQQDARQGRGDAAGGGEAPGAFPTAAAITGGPDGWSSWNGTA